MAADAIGLTQPSVSNGLNKIRQHFNDPLFIRVGNEMIPTELAKQIFHSLSEVIDKVESINNFNVNFDPLTSDQLFTIAMTDVSHLVLLPQLTNYLKEKAPLIRLNIRPITPETSYQMANGEIDLAMGFTAIRRRFYQQKFFGNTMS